MNRNFNLLKLFTVLCCLLAWSSTQLSAQCPPANRTVSNCKSGTPNDAIGAVFKDFFSDGTSPGWLFETGGTFVENGDGTADMTAVLAQYPPPSTRRFLMKVHFIGQTYTPPAGSPMLLNTTPNTSGWYYYDWGTATLTGLDDLAGAQLNLFKRGKFAQFGIGGADQVPDTSNFGASAWFSWQIVSQPTNTNIVINEFPAFPSIDQGDLCFTLSGTPTDCRPKGCIGDQTFLDKNNNGVYDAGDAPATGLTITLFDANFNVLATQAVDANGNYKFTDLSAGTYFIAFPTATLDGTPITSTSPIKVVLADGECNLNADAAYYKPEPKGCIGDQTFLDKNNNGVYDAGDAPATNLTITLCDENFVTLATQAVDANGNYKFSNLPAATYYIKFPTATLDGIPLTSTSPIKVVLAAGECNLNADAAYYKATCENYRIAYYSLDQCSPGTSYTEFVGAFDKRTGFSALTGSTLRNNCGASHSCNYGVNNKPAICTKGVNTSTASTSLFASALALDISATPVTGNKGSISQICFYQRSTNPATFISGSSQTNNRLQKLAVRVLKNGVAVFTKYDIPTTSAWGKVTVALPTPIEFTANCKITFEVVGYNPAYVAFCSNYIYDIDEIEVYGKSCVNDDPCATDVTPPTIKCPADITKDVTGMTGTCWKITYPNATATDNCGTPTVACISGPASGSCFTVGTSTITFKATDAKGNSSTCSFKVNITKTTPVCSVNFSSTKCYRIVNVASGKVLDVSGGGTANNCSIIQWSYHGGTNQQTRLYSLGSGYYKIVFRNSGRVLANHNTTSGSNCYLYDYYSGGYKDWKIECNTDGTYKITHRASSKVLDIESSSTNDGGIVEIDSWTGVNSQKWRIEEVACNTSSTLLASNSVLTMDATAEVSRTRIEWINNTGYQNDFFTVQKINSTTGNFEDMETVNAFDKTEELQHFTSYDNTPTEGDNYYRVKVTRNDGTEQVSETKKVRYSKLDDVRVFPNPATDIVDIDLAKFKGDEVGIHVYNQFGQQVLFKTIDNVGEMPVSLDISQIPPGNILIRVTAKGKRDVTKQVIVTK